MKRIFCLIASVALLLSCKDNYKYTEGNIYGTTYHISYQSKQNYDDEIREQLDIVNQQLSMFNDKSLISRVNNNEDVELDSLFVYMFDKAYEVNRNTRGAFDITVGPLKNAWGFGKTKEGLPTEEKIDSIMDFVGMDNIYIENNHIVKYHPNVQLDASGIAKGLGVDLVADFFESNNIENYMVEVGGEVRVKGQSHKKRPWRIGIDTPNDDVNATTRELTYVLEMSGGALATSGNYRRFYIIDGRKYAHIIDPSTGYPVEEEILGASVYATTCMEADAYATAFMVLGLDESLKVLEENPHLKACLIYRDEFGEMQIWMSEGLSNMILQE